MKYKSVVLTKRGGPEVLKIDERELKSPAYNEVQIKVSACGVGRTDIAMRYGYYPYAPKIPFVPGYEIVGEITAIGAGVKKFQVGDRVGALSVYGGYSEYIYLEESHLVRVPESVEADEAAAVILNYGTAYQILHRILKVKKGDKVLITGASGGVGSALIDLGKLSGLKMYGTASAESHTALKENGIFPLDYKSKNWPYELKKQEQKGLDYVIDAIGGRNINLGFSLLKKGGRLAEYGYPNFRGMLLGLLKIKVLNLLSSERKGVFYGISASYKKDKTTIHEDMRSLFKLLEDGKIKPIIAERYPILKAQYANRVLEEKPVHGKIVLVSEPLD